MSEKADNTKTVEFRWGCPHQSKKFHIFCNSMSLCRKWGFFDGDDLVSDGPQTARKDDCIECVRKLNEARGDGK